MLLLLLLLLLVVEIIHLFRSTIPFSFPRFGPLSSIRTISVQCDNGSASPSSLPQALSLLHIYNTHIFALKYAGILFYHIYGYYIVSPITYAFNRPSMLFHFSFFCNITVGIGCCCCFHLLEYIQFRFFSVIQYNEPHRWRVLHRNAFLEKTDLQIHKHKSNT